ncbi:hypothetical protein N0V90_001865 [Kalmusia sp. IMI 367209]|nr:hypothetical protein N0V90_001865 [Kalmusia sp. IMI 367209]
MSTPNVVLIFGAGKRVGAGVAAKFASNGHKVAVVSRSGTGSINEQGYLSLKADVNDPTSIAPAFDAVQAEFKIAPNVVVYNAGALHFPSNFKSVLSIPAVDVASDLNANTVSPFAAAQEAVERWETLPRDIKKTFIFTGNALNELVVPFPSWMNLGMGKSATAYWINFADKAYKAKGYRFFYADERKADGTADGEIDGPYHGEFYAHLASHEGNVPWQATFVKDKGYVYFDPKSIDLDKVWEMNQEVQAGIAKKLGQ